MFNNFNGLFFIMLSYPHLNPVFTLLCKASAGKRLQSSIALWKRYFSLFALDLLSDYFIRKPSPIKWEKPNNNGPFHSIHYLTELYYNPISSQIRCAALDAAPELYNPHGTNAYTSSCFCWHSCSQLSFISTPSKFHRWVQLRAHFLSAATPRAKGTFLVNKTNS